MPASRIDTLARVGFVLFAIVLVTATHWPNLRVESGIPRTDLWAHFSAYFLWTSLLLSTGWLGPRFSWRALGLGVPLAILYAGIDELSQGIPGLGRTVAWSDFAANCVGVELAALVWVGLTLVKARGQSRLP
jgi:VanZ family protein